MGTRREFLKRTGLGYGLALGFGIDISGAEESSAGRPNFMWLVSEDNSKHFMRLFDEHGAAAPNIEKLAQDGVRFTHAFSNLPVCSAARSSLATCCYGSRIGTHFHRKHVAVPLPEGVHNFAGLLREAGYYTSNKKKRDYNFKDTIQAWDSSSDWRGRQPEQPFFHMQSFGTTHESSLHKSVSAEMTPEGARVFIPPIHPDTPTFRNTYARYHGRIEELDRQIAGVVDELRKDGLLEETFIFYFGDHGGVLPGSKGYAHETGLHVPLVIRIPEKYKDLVDLKRNSSVDGFVSFIDFGATLLHLAGVRVPDGMDGRPFMGPGISLKELNKRDETFGMADRFDEKYDMVRTLRKGRFKYTRNYQPFNFDGLQNNYRYRMDAYRQWRELYREGKLNDAQSQFFEPRPPEALYDIEADPYETENLAENPDHTKKLLDLRGRLAEKVKELPDLSFFPESYLVSEAFAAPVSFGRARKQEIAELVDIADLSLLPFDKAEGGIAAVLSSKNRWKRYWGLIVCSSHGSAAAGFTDRARDMAGEDPELLVRVRAAEFLGLIGAEDPGPVMEDVLAKSEDPIVTLLALNSVVLLQDGKPGYDFNITPDDVTAANGNVKRRLEYLVEGTPNPRRKGSRNRSAAGKRLPETSTLNRKNWKVHHVSSQEGRGQAAANVFDGDPQTCWHTQWRQAKPKYPHELQIDLGGRHTVRGIRILNRQDRARNAKIAEFELFIGDDPEGWGEAVASGTLTETLDEQEILFDSVRGAYFRLRALSGHDNRSAAIAELEVLTE